VRRGRHRAANKLAPKKPRKLHWWQCLEGIENLTTGECEPIAVFDTSGSAAGFQMRSEGLQVREQEGLSWNGTEPEVYISPDGERIVLPAFFVEQTIDPAIRSYLAAGEDEDAAVSIFLYGDPMTGATGLFEGIQAPFETDAQVAAYTQIKARAHRSLVRESRVR